MKNILYDTGYRGGKSRCFEEPKKRSNLCLRNSKAKFSCLTQQS